METEVGKVVHYYDKLGVAIVELSAGLAVGDTIKVTRGEGEFEQPVTSMQVEHESVTSAKRGDAVGIKVAQKAKEGAVVYRVTA
jgi:putative protease